MYPNLRQFNKFAFDTETTGLQYPVDRVFGFSISTPDGKDYYYDVRQTPKAIQWFNEEVRDYRGDIVCHNASFDYRMATVTGFRIPITQLDDTVIRAGLIDEHLVSYSLDNLGKVYLGETKVATIYQELADIFGGLATRNMQMPNLQHAPIEVTAPYAKQDTRLTLNIHDLQDKMIKAQGIERIVTFERSRMPQFIKTEMAGIRVDLDEAERAADKLEPIIAKTQAKLDELAGGDFNCNSGPQVKKLFAPEYKDGAWFACDGTKLETTATEAKDPDTKEPLGYNNPSLGADALREMTHPAAQLILNIRSDIKTRDTFLRGHILGHAVGDREIGRASCRERV